MRKNFLYLGILLLILGIILAFASPSFALPSQFSSPSSQIVLVNASLLGYVPMQLNQSGLVVLTFNASAPVDFYLANTTAFLQINGKSVANSSARSTAIGLEGNGVYEIYQGSTDGTFPFTTVSGTSKPNYIVSNLSTFASGTYYAVFANSGSKTVQIELTALPISLTQLESSTSSLGTYFMVAALVFIIGIGLMVFAFISKGGKAQTEEAKDKQAQQEFDKIEGKSKKGKK